MRFLLSTARIVSGVNLDKALRPEMPSDPSTLATPNSTTVIHPKIAEAP